MAAEPRPSTPGDAGPSPRGAANAPLRMVQGGVLDDELQADLDGLFTDADQHGPRAGALVLRIVPALVVLVAAVVATGRSSVREAVFGAAGAELSSTLLVAPVLALVVLLGATMAPLARTSAVRLVAAGVVLLGASAVLVRGGDVVAATVPASFGGLLLGIGASRAVRRAVWVLPLLLAAGISDARSVQNGLTEDLLAAAAGDGAVAAPTLEVVQVQLAVPAAQVAGLDYVVLHVPAASGLWVFGIVDVVAIGLLLGLTHLYWRPAWLTAVAFAGVVVATTATDVPIPVLPFLGLAWLVVNAPLVWRSTRFTIRRLMYLGG